MLLSRATFPLSRRPPESGPAARQRSCLHPCHGLRSDTKS